jgi:hypothetical protein
MYEMCTRRADRGLLTAIGESARMAQSARA